MNDRINGVVYGQLIGDALGISTEFMTKKNVYDTYKNDITYDNIISDEHRNNWEKGEWSDDGDMFFVILNHILDTEDFLIDSQLLSKKFIEWYNNVMNIYGKIKLPNGTGKTIRRVFQHPLFLKNDKNNGLYRCNYYIYYICIF